MTKIKLKLHDLLVDAVGGETSHIPATVEVSELLDFNDAFHGEVDLEDLLSENRLIAQIWGVEDVRSIRPELNDDQAWDVLQQIEKNFDGNRGVTWDMIERTAYDLFGTSPAKRVERCDDAVSAYNDDLPESNLIDFLADAMHWCRAKGFDFNAKLELARAHFDAEAADE